MPRTSRLLSADSLGRAVAELVLIVAGVLIALGVDGAIERQREREIARESLALIRNDLVQLVEQAEELQVFNTSLQQAAGTAYDALAAEGPVERRPETWRALVALSGRRTARFPRAAYDELVGTGNLRALEDEALSADLVRFYEALARDEEVILRNNEAFTDGHLNRLLIGEALIVGLPDDVARSGIPVVNAAVAELRTHLPEGPSWEGRIWELPPGDPDRRRLQSAVVTVGTVASAHLVLARQARARAAELVTRIDGGLGAPTPTP